MSTKPLFDLIIKNGLVIDPSQDIQDVKDVAIYQGNIAAIDDDLNSVPGEDALKVIDASERIVTPGLIDLHVHVGIGYRSLNPNCLLISGATTNLDAGTYGAANFDSFRYLSQNSISTLYAYLNISAIGLTDRPELEILEYGNVEKAVETCKRNRNFIKGIKVRLTLNALGHSSSPIEALLLAKEAAKKTRLPMHVHGIRTNQEELLKGLKLKDVLMELRKGDILTHTYAKYSGIIGENGQVIPEAEEAAQRGVIFDVGHGSGSFDWKVAEKCLSAEVGPKTISTDLHQSSIMGPCFDMATTMSKYLFMGCTMDEVINMATFAPANAIQMDDNIGTLKLGANADVTLFQLKKGQFTLYDTFGNHRIVNEMLIPKLVVCKGTVYLAGSWREANWIQRPKLNE